MMRRLSLAATAALFVLLEPAGAAPPTQTGSADTFKALNLFAEVFDKVRSDYVEPVKDDDLVENAINGMLTSLDPHSSYMNAKAYKDMQVDTHGEFGGLGLEVVEDQGLVKVVSPIDDTPSAKAGIKAGDYIVALDGDPIVNLTLNDAVEKMRGAPGTTIKITLRREGEPKPIDLTLTRAIIKVASVRGHLERDNIAYLRISSFKEQTSTELEDTYKKLKTQAGGKLTGVVLDLRNNPGGLLDQAIGVSDDFLERGEIVSTRGRRPEDVQRYNAHPGEMTNGLPVVVLINGGSASASEIVAGALQDHHRAVILGTKSFGKGSVQTIIPVPGQGAMRLTTARYFTPSGRSIQAKGIEPDILVEPSKIEKIGGQERLHESDLKGALKNPDDVAKAAATKAAATPKDPAAAKDPDVAVPVPGDVVDPTASAKADDYQLTRALDLLKGVSLFSARAVD